jgi:hypothetical protein
MPSEGRAELMLPGKVQARHLDRLAIVYVRQSTLQQLEHHRESTALQYGLAERACNLGWPRPRVSVIDDDLGCSGASAEGRPGSRCRGSPGPAATGTSCSRSAPSPAR